MTGLVKVMQDLDKIKADSDPNNSGKAKQLLTELAAACRADAELTYQNSTAENSDNIKVSDDVTGNTATITAQGDGILFVEFGTGINRNNGSVSLTALTKGFLPSSWSMSHSQWLLPPKVDKSNGKWPIPGTFGQATKIIKTKSGPKEVPSNIWTEGHPPVDAMYHTFERLKNSYFPEKAKDIFK